MEKIKVQEEKLKVQQVVVWKVENEVFDAEWKAVKFAAKKWCMKELEEKFGITRYVADDFFERLYKRLNQKINKGDVK